MEMYFMDNDAEGVRVAWFPSHVLKTYIVPRTKLKEAKRLVEHDRLEHGVYFLVGDTIDGEKTKIYSGQTTQGVQRLMTHDATKDLNSWNKAILFLADSHAFNKDVISGLELLAIQATKECEKSGRYKVMNGQTPTCQIDIYHQGDVDSYFEDIKFFMGWLGYALTRSEGKKSQRIFHTARRGIVAQGVYSGERFEVLQGSMVDVAKLPGLKSYQDLRAELLESGAISKDERGIYRLNENRSFGTPSGASDFILGGSTNGWTEWKDVNGCTLDQVYRAE
jgi:hypothetical protein